MFKKGATTTKRVRVTTTTATAATTATGTTTTAATAISIYNYIYIIFLIIYESIQLFIEWDDGKTYMHPLYLMAKTMVSCRFSLKPIHWIIHHHNTHFILLKNRDAPRAAWLGTPMSGFSLGTTFRARWQLAVHNEDGFESIEVEMFIRNGRIDKICIDLFPILFWDIDIKWIRLILYIYIYIYMLWRSFEV